MTAFIPCLAALHLCSSLPVSHNSLLMHEWWPPVSAGLSAVLVCLLFVARDWGTDGVLRFPLQRVGSTKCIIVQNGFCCTHFFYTAINIWKKKTKKLKHYHFIICYIQLSLLVSLQCRLFNLFILFIVLRIIYMSINIKQQRFLSLWVKS